VRRPDEERRAGFRVGSRIVERPRRTNRFDDDALGVREAGHGPLVRSLAACFGSSIAYRSLRAGRG